MITRTLLITLGMCIAALAQTTQPDEVVTRVYDVRELLITIPNFPFEGALGLPTDYGNNVVGGGGGGGGSQSLFGGGQGVPVAEQQAMGQQQRAQSIIKLLMDTIDPTSWRDAGGKIGSIRELSGQLVVTHTAAVQQQVATVLKELRSSEALVRVQADWVMLTPDQINPLLARSKDDKPPKVIDRTALNQLAGQAPHYRAELSCFDGQMVSIDSGRSRTMVYDGEPVVAQNAAALNPDVRRVEAGMMLEVMPVVLSESDTAIVQIRSAFAEWTKPEKVEMSYSTTQPGGSNVQGPTAIDRLNVLRQELRSAVRIPLNQAVLIGGMTLEPTMEMPQGAQLYLILQVSASR